MKSRFMLFIPLLVIILSVILLYPNFAERELVLKIHPEAVHKSEEYRKSIVERFSGKWKEKYNADGSMSIYPDPAGAHNVDQDFVVRGKFITSAKINQISQENSELFLESGNKIKPVFIEEFVKNGKLMIIRLGLDLQGGMRVVLKGDFENYTDRLREMYADETARLNTVLTSNASEEEKKNAENRLAEIEENYQLTPERKIQELEKAKLIIDNRLANQNLSEPQVRIQKDSDSVEVSLPGVSNSNEILEILQNTETVEYRLEESSGKYISKIIAEEQNLLMQDKRKETDIVKYQELIKSRRGSKAEKKFLEDLEQKYGIAGSYKLLAIWERGSGKKSVLLPRKFIVLEKSIVLSGNDLSDARPFYNQNDFGWAVSFTLTPSGAEKFFEVTKNNRGRNMAIIWGDKVVSNPTINDPIAGGRAEITGSFSKDQAIRLSNVISEGALPVPLKVLEMRFIGPTLGQESIELGIKAVAMGFVLVMIYMVFYYKLAGIVADIALLVNLLILAALLSLLDFTLTLPGFAGIVLTVGMAVDANVIIYERIREEIRSGKNVANSVSIGFENAFWTIIDSNLTTLIAGILMIKLGNGPIKGFAITLCWGIITSLFTSLFMSRLIMEMIVNNFNITKLNVGFNVYKGTGK